MKDFNSSIFRWKEVFQSFNFLGPSITSLEEKVISQTFPFSQKNMRMNGKLGLPIAFISSWIAKSRSQYVFSAMMR